VQQIRFHDLGHTFLTRMAAAGQSLRAIQEFLGRADITTTQIYTYYAPLAHEVPMVNEAFALSSGAEDHEQRGLGAAGAEDLDPRVFGVLDTRCRPSQVIGNVSSADAKTSTSPHRGETRPGPLQLPTPPCRAWEPAPRRQPPPGRATTTT
jgi:hypothetical protein